MNSKSNTLILAGGFGTRMADQFPGLPKPLIPVMGIPILERIIQECQKYGFDLITILLHFDEKKIRDYFGNGEKFGVRINYIVEKKPLGTGGALMLALPNLSDQFFVLYSDVYSDLNLASLLDFHTDGNQEFTVVAHPNSHPYDSDLLVLDPDDRVVEVCPHPHSESKYLRNMVNAAMYVVDKACLKNLKNKIGEKFDIAQSLIPELIDDGKVVRAYKTTEYLKDMGTPVRLEKVEQDIQKNIPYSRSLLSKKSAIFLDRDGTINYDYGHIDSPEKIQLIDGASEAISRLNNSTYLTICTTNQPVIARGAVDSKSFDVICGAVDTALGNSGAYLDDIFHCPHHPESGFEGEVSQLKKFCQCRKPNIGMFMQAEASHNIDLKKSWVVGDRTADIRAAQNINARSVLVQTGSAGLDAQYPTRPTFLASDLSHAVEHILSEAKFIEEFMICNSSTLAESELIFVSGCARAGKSTFASQIKWYLGCAGFSAHILELDGYLRSDRKESEAAIRRYDWDSIRGSIQSFLNPDILVYQDLTMDHITGKASSLGFETIGANRVLIVEGTFANYVSSYFSRPSTKIFVDQSDYVRQKRFFSKYLARDLSTTECNELWDRRKVIEDVEIIKQRGEADLIYASPLGGRKE